MKPPRVLLAILVYNGRAFVPACLRSAARLTGHGAGVDVLVLDDCSPEPGWSDELRGICADLGLGYYRSPRNIGIPRNMNLALLHAIEAGYAHVAVINSDVVFPLNLADALVATVQADPRIGSATAWSNDVSIYSLTSVAPALTDGGEDLTGVRLDRLDSLSSTLQAEFGTECLDIPTGVGFCLFTPVDAVRRVGLFDPVFGRGYCEEVDWCLRAAEAGYRNVLAPSTFMYHAGRGSTSSTGMVEQGQTTVWANEKIVDLRHPGYRASIEAFLAGGSCDALRRRAEECLVREAARTHGYSVEITATDRPSRDDGGVRFVVSSTGEGHVASGRYLGATTRYQLNGAGTIRGLEAILGLPPQKVTVYEQGPHGDGVVEEAAREGIPTVNARVYPECI
jgi:GT2 family glycosyltransferase